MVGLFWIIDEGGQTRVLALMVPLSEAIAYGDMLTIETGHFDYWTELAARGARVLRAEGLPTAPVWSDYDEWPRGRVLYDRCAFRFVIRADSKLHRPPFLQLIARRFQNEECNILLCGDDHYESVRTVASPTHSA